MSISYKDNNIKQINKTGDLFLNLLIFFSNFTWFIFLFGGNLTENV